VQVLHVSHVSVLLLIVNPLIFEEGWWVCDSLFKISYQINHSRNYQLIFAYKAFIFLVLSKSRTVMLWKEALIL
jgi:hypothetical protein